MFYYSVVFSFPLLMQRPVKGIRDCLYGFVRFTPKHLDGKFKGDPKTERAMDISFGTRGYTLVLARAFKKVAVYWVALYHVWNSITTSTPNEQLLVYYDANCDICIYIQVISVNFDPYFRNEKEPVKRDIFYTNYVSVNYPEDIFSHSSDTIKTVRNM